MRATTIRRRSSTTAPVNFLLARVARIHVRRTTTPPPPLTMAAAMQCWVAPTQAPATTTRVLTPTTALVISCPVRPSAAWMPPRATSTRGHAVQLRTMRVCRFVLRLCRTASTFCGLCLHGRSPLRGEPICEENVVLGCTDPSANRTATMRMATATTGRVNTAMAVAPTPWPATSPERHRRRRFL